jgi:hypothetical protein
MRFSLHVTFLLLALAHTLVGPTNAKANDPLERHLLKRVSDSFYKTAFRHSAGLARDLRTAFRGLGKLDATVTRRSLVARSNNKPFCISNPAGSPNKANSTSNANHSPNTSSSASATSTRKGSPTTTGVSGSSPTSNFHIVQSYVRVSRLSETTFFPPARDFEIFC